MRLLYDIFFILFSIAYLPYFLLKGKYHRGLLQRFGIFKGEIFSDIAEAKPIWLHAVSVGEMKTAEGLIAKMRNICPSKRFVISNVTRTGHDVAASIAGREDLVIYFPVDLSFVVKRLIRLIRPSLFIMIETEIWPNLIAELARNDIPIVLMNGRISPKSFRNYRLIRPVIRRILKDITLFCMRTDKDAERIKALGAVPEKIKATGNMKFDAAPAKGENKSDPWPAVKNKLWLSSSSEVLIAGSTHRGEDKKILSSYKILKKEYPNLNLLIAPRHIERVGEISALIERSGLKAVRLTEAEKRFSDAAKSCDSARPAEDNAAAYDNNSVFILDSIGRLASLYKLATVVFMGGSLVPHGGHNFIEPAIFAKPMITGPHVHNFKDMCDLFIDNEAIELVNNNDGLLSSLRRLLSDKDRRNEMGERARKVVFENIGSTERNIELIRQYL